MRAHYFYFLLHSDSTSLPKLDPTSIVGAMKCIKWQPRDPERYREEIDDIAKQQYVEYVEAREQLRASSLEQVARGSRSSVLQSFDALLMHHW